MHTKWQGTKKLTILGILLAVGLVLGLAESLIPIFSVLPGAKLGIANVVTMLALVWFGPWEALLLGVLRAGLGGVFSGAITMAAYGGVGAVLSVASMWVVRRLVKKRVSLAGVSMVGAFFFQVGQLIVAAVVVHNIQLFRYLPTLVLISTICGLLTGILAEQIAKKNMGGVKAWQE